MIEVGDVAYQSWEAYEANQSVIFPDDAFKAGFAAGQAHALDQAATVLTNDPNYHDPDGLLTGWLRSAAARIRENR